MYLGIVLAPAVSPLPGMGKETKKARWTSWSVGLPTQRSPGGFFSLSCVPRCLGQEMGVCRVGENRRLRSPEGTRTTHTAMFCPLLAGRSVQWTHNATSCSSDSRARLAQLSHLHPWLWL